MKSHEETFWSYTFQRKWLDLWKKRQHYAKMYSFFFPRKLGQGMPSKVTPGSINLGQKVGEGRESLDQNLSWAICGEDKTGQGNRKIGFKQIQWVWGQRDYPYMSATW